MRIFALLFVSLTLLSAYQKGDRLDENIIQQLQLKKEKIYIIDFFASWCKSCKREMPDLAKVSRTVNHQKVELIGIDVDEDTSCAEKFQKTLKKAGNLPFRVINDPKGKIIGRFDPMGTPAVYIIQNHKIVAVEIGAKNHIDTLIMKHIEGLQ